MVKKNSSLKICAIIPAGGMGKRLYSKIRKPYIKLCGKPMLYYTLSVFEKSPLINEIICAVHKDDVKYCTINILKRFGFKKTRLVSGGKERFDSVYNALKMINSKKVGIIVIHDSARPFLKKDILARSIEAAKKFGASCVAVKTKNTIKKVDKNLNVIETPDRKFLWDAQTPQSFQAGLILKAYSKASVSKKIFTDDASCVENLGKRVKIVEGSWENIKITTPEDVVMGEAILRSKIIRN